MIPFFTFLGCGVGMMLNSNVVIVQQYFDKKRGIASALSKAGLAFGAIIGSWFIYFGLEEVRIQAVHI